jgi:hypothetical protein
VCSSFYCPDDESIKNSHENGEKNKDVSLVGDGIIAISFLTWTHIDYITFSFSFNLPLPIFFHNLLWKSAKTFLLHYYKQWLIFNEISYDYDFSSSITDLAFKDIYKFARFFC